MGTACIIEQEPLIVRQIEVALKEIDGRMEFLLFKDLEEFYQWFSSLINTPPDPKAKPIDLKLLIGDIKFLGPNYFSLIEKVRKLMVRRGILKKEDDLAILLTAFESPTLNIKQIESRIITNIIFKPFDQPILRQHLQVALANQKAITDFVVFNQRLKASAEMLKDVHLEAFTELGFTTRSDRELKVDDISKYYGRHFEVGNKRSVLARCISCKPHPTDSGQFQAEFMFYGLSNPQAKKFRQTLFGIEHARSPDQKLSKVLVSRSAGKTNMVDQSINLLVFLTDETEANAEIKENLERSLKNINVIYNSNLPMFMEAFAKDDFSMIGKQPIHAILFAAEHFGSPASINTWTKLQAQITDLNQQYQIDHPKPKIFLSAEKEIPEDKLRSWGGLISEILYHPIDRPYFFKHLVSLFPSIHPRSEDMETYRLETNEAIQVANPIELASLSEACLTMKYYRPVSFHSYRSFCLPSFHGEEVLEILASCYFTEKKDGGYINHFVFFGITDKYLKYIRKWILERHIASKEGAA